MSQLRVCTNCGAKSNFPGVCPACGFDAAKARHNMKESWRLVFCDKCKPACHYFNAEGQCPTHGTIGDAKSDPDKTPTDWPKLVF